MNILVDMNFSPSWVDFLTGAGFTAVHWSDEGAPNTADRDLVVWAADRGYVLLTADLDLTAHLAAAARRAGVLQVRCGVMTPDALGSAVLGAIHRTRTALETGAVVTIDAETDEIEVVSQPNP